MSAFYLNKCCNKYYDNEKDMKWQCNNISDVLELLESNANNAWQYVIESAT